MYMCLAMPVFVAACGILVVQCEIQLLTQGSNLSALHWDHGVLATGTREVPRLQVLLQLASTYFCLPEFPLGKHSFSGSVSSLPPSMVFPPLTLAFPLQAFPGSCSSAPTGIGVHLMAHYTLFPAALPAYSPQAISSTPWHQLLCRFWKTLYTTSMRWFLFDWFWIAREIVEFPQLSSQVWISFPCCWHNFWPVLPNLLCCHLRTFTVCPWRIFAATLCFLPLVFFLFFVILAVMIP